MRPLVKYMIHKWEMKKIDWMGYETKHKNDFDFHHLIISHKDCKTLGLGQGYELWNGAILNSLTSHPFLHQIENFDYDLFAYISKLLAKENAMGKIDVQVLENINACLNSYEREMQGKKNSKGKALIKPEYTIRNYKNYFR